MSSNQSKDDIRKQQLLAMGAELGELYNALYNEVIWLHAKWLEFRKLYAVSPQQIVLLNETAGFFFYVVEDVLWNDVLLHLARLIASPKSMGNDNLTLKRLPEALTQPELVAEVQRLIDQAETKTSFVPDWRNRRLAHTDLALALQDQSVQPLSKVSRQDIESALEAFRNVLNRISEEYGLGQTGFEYFQSHGNAEALVYQLRVAVAAENQRQERFRRGKPLPEDLETPPEA